jgi:hypothetical protein
LSATKTAKEFVWARTEKPRIFETNELFPSVGLWKMPGMRIVGFLLIVVLYVWLGYQTHWGTRRPAFLGNGEQGFADLQDWNSWAKAHVSLAPNGGAFDPDAPDQQDVPGGDRGWNCRGYDVRPLARYRVEARILHRESYLMDREADLSPVDFALGWGRMAQPAIYQQLTIGQGGRWYSWHWYGSAPPIPESEIIAHSANTHLIPATDEIDSQLSHAQAGDVVKLAGYLVAIQGSDGWHWSSSLSRTDTGAGSCELLWVTSCADLGR